MLSMLSGSPLGAFLSTFFISILPVVELRGGIPWGVAHGLSFWEAYGISVMGNLLPVPFIILFLRKVFDWLRRFSGPRRFVDFLETHAQSKGKRMERYEALGLFILVAIPLPGTGAWTGALVASVFEMRIKKALPIITAGVLTAGIIMLLVSKGAISLI